MTPSEQKLYNAIHRRTQDVAPELAYAMLRAWQRIRDSMTDAALARAIALGFGESIVEQIITQAILDVALLPLRQRLRDSIVRGVPYYTKTLPPKLAEISIGFDILSPHVVTAIRQLETRVLTQFGDDVKEALRTSVRIGLENGQSSRTVARGLRDMIGLAPNQVRDVANYRTKLEHAHEQAGALDNTLRDRRYDSVIAKARKAGEPLTPAQIDRMVDAYRKRRIAQNAATNARQAAVESQKLANRLAWQSAVDDGAIVTKRWSGVMDERERPEHVAHEGETVPFNQPYRGGYMVAGLGDWGCRCVDIYRAVA